MTATDMQHAAAATGVRFGRLLTRSFALVAVLGVSAALIAVLTTGLVLQQTYARDNLQLMAQQAVYSAEIPIVFNDRNGLASSLAPIIDSDTVAAVRVVGADGTTMLDSSTSGSESSFSLVPEFLMPGTISLPVTTGGSQIGTVHLTGSSVGVTRLFIASIIGALLSMGAIVLSTMVIARRLRRALIEPIERIAQVVHDVRADGDFSRRVQGAQVAEVDALAGDINALLGQLQDWQGQVTSTHEALLHRASFDPLSGLPNRATFTERARNALRAAHRSGGRVGILFMDGDNFKATNDRFGHAAGDRMIAQIGARVPQLLRVGDVVARMGGDEFAVLIHHIEQEGDVESVATRIEEVMQQPVQVTEEDSVVVGLSIGMAIYPDDGDDVEQLIQTADDRMYAAKKQRKSGP